MRTVEVFRKILFWLRNVLYFLAMFFAAMGVLLVTIGAVVLGIWLLFEMKSAGNGGGWSLALAIVVLVLIVFALLPTLFGAMAGMIPSLFALLSVTLKNRKAKFVFELLNSITLGLVSISGTISVTMGIIGLLFETPPSVMSGDDVGPLVIAVIALVIYGISSIFDLALFTLTLISGVYDIKHPEEYDLIFE